MCHACTTTKHFIQTWWHVIPNRIQVMLDSTYGEQEQILYYAFDHTCYYNMVVRYNRRNELFGTPPVVLKLLDGWCDYHRFTVFHYVRYFCVRLQGVL